MDIGSFASGLGGVIVGSGIILVIVKGWRDELVELKKKVETDQANKITAIEHNVSAILKDCAPCQTRSAQHARILEELKPDALTFRMRMGDTQFEKIDGKLDKLCEQVARVETNQANQKEDIERAHKKISHLRLEIGKPD